MMKCIAPTLTAADSNAVEYPGGVLGGDGSDTKTFTCNAGDWVMDDFARPPPFGR